MSRSKGAAPALKGRGANVTSRASILGAPGSKPATGDRRNSELVDLKVRQSEGHRSIWESPQRHALQAAKRAGMGGRTVRIRVSDGPVMDRNGRPCTTRLASGRTQRAD